MAKLFYDMEKELYLSTKDFLKMESKLDICLFHFRKDSYRVGEISREFNSYGLTVYTDFIDANILGNGRKFEDYLVQVIKSVKSVVVVIEDLYDNSWWTEFILSIAMVYNKNRAIHILTPEENKDKNYPSFVNNWPITHTVDDIMFRIK